MNGRPSDEDFDVVLASWEEALDAGDEVRCREILDRYPHLADRLQRSRDCLRALGTLLGSSRESAARHKVETWTAPRDPTPVDSAAWRSSSASPDGVEQRLGRFELREELGRGGCGVVYRAWDPQLQRDVALKVPRPELLASPEWQQRFEREARAAARLEHPNVAAVYEAGAVGPIRFLVAAYCPGPNLEQWLQDRDTPTPWKEAVTLTGQLADAVHHAHERGVLHRDLKPGNVLLVPVPLEEDVPGTCRLGGALYVPRLTDFGLARVLSDAGHDTRDESVLGTPAFMAPEQAGGSLSQCGRPSDVYSLGAILYYLLTGRPPHVGSTAMELLEAVRSVEPLPLRASRADVPRDVQTVLTKCLEKDPRRRYHDAAELATDLRAAVVGAPIRARRVGSLERAWRRARRNPVVSGLAAALLLAIAGSLWATWFLRRDVNRHELDLQGKQREIARLDSERRAAAAREHADLGMLRRQLDIQLVQLRDASLTVGSGDHHLLLAEQVAGLLAEYGRRDPAWAAAGLEAAGPWMEVGRFSAAMGRFRDAKHSWEQAETLGRRTAHGEAAAFRREQARAEVWQGRVARWEGRPADAERHLRQAEAWYAALIEEHDGYLVDRIEEAEARLLHARLLRETEDHAACRSLLDELVTQLSWTERSDAYAIDNEDHRRWLSRETNLHGEAVLYEDTTPVRALRAAMQLSLRGRGALAAALDERARFYTELGEDGDAVQRDFARAGRLRHIHDRVDSYELQLSAARHERYRAEWLRHSGEHRAAAEIIQDAWNRLVPWRRNRPLMLEAREELCRIVALQARIAEEGDVAFPETPPADVHRREAMQLRFDFPELELTW